MDLSLSEEQQSIADLAGQILTEQAAAATRCARSRPTRRGAGSPTTCGTSSAKADLLGVCLPESVGGGGYGFMEACLILEQQGRTVAPLPLMPTLVLGALPDRAVRLAEQQQSASFPASIDGSTILTARALRDRRLRRADGAGDRRRPPTATAGASTARRSSCPPHTSRRRCSCPHGRTAAVGVFLVDPHGDGVELERNEAINDEPLFTVRFDGARRRGARRRRTTAATIVDWITDRAIAALCSIQAGVCDDGAAAHGDVRVRARAVRLEDRHVPSRRAADRRRLHRHRRHPPHRASRPRGGSSEELPANDEVHIAKFWAVVRRRPRRARRAAPARRRRRRPRLPDPPLLPVEQGDRADAGHGDRAPAPASGQTNRGGRPDAAAGDPRSERPLRWPPRRPRRRPRRRGRSHHRPHRSQRRGQDHDVQRHHRAAGDVERQGHPRRQGALEAARRTSGPGAASRARSSASRCSVR